MKASYDRNRSGLLKNFRSKGSMESALRAAELYEELGVAVKRLDAREIVAREPALAPIADQISGAVFYPDDESGDAFKFTQAIAAAATAHGAEFCFSQGIRSPTRDGDRIVAVETDSGSITGELFVLAAGSYSPRVARTAGVSLPIYPAKGYSITLDVPGWNEAPRIPIVDDEFKVAITPLGSRLRVAGTMEFAGFDTSQNERRGRILKENLAAILPHHPKGAFRHWSGLRPLTPSGVPIIGRVGLRNLLVNAGHGPLGWTLAAGCSRMIATLVAGQS